MIKILLSTALICLVSIIVPAQSLRQPISAIYLGLSSYSTQHMDVFSYLNNQASLAQIKNISAGMYGEKRFLLSATSLYTVALAIPTKKGNFGVNIKYSGFQNFNESQIGFAYARSLNKQIDIGMQFNYYNYRIPAYSGASTVNFEIGAILHLADHLNLGVHVYNPVGGTFSKTNEKLTAAYKVALGYDVSDILFISTEIIKEENFPINLNSGIQYRFMKQFFARVGLASATSTGYAGFGVSWSSFRLDVTGSYHPQLGFSPGLLFIINIGSIPAASVTETF